MTLALAEKPSETHDPLSSAAPASPTALPVGTLSFDKVSSALDALTHSQSSRLWSAQAAINLLEQSGGSDFVPNITTAVNMLIESAHAGSIMGTSPETLLRQMPTTAETTLAEKFAEFVQAAIAQNQSIDPALSQPQRRSMLALRIPAFDLSFVSGMMAGFAPRTMVLSGPHTNSVKQTVIDGLTAGAVLLQMDDDALRLHVPEERLSTQSRALEVYRSTAAPVREALLDRTDLILLALDPQEKPIGRAASEQLTKLVPLLSEGGLLLGGMNALAAKQRDAVTTIAFRDLHHSYQVFTGPEQRYFAIIRPG